MVGLFLVAVVGSILAGWFLNNRFGRRSLEAINKRADETVRNARREAEKVKRASVIEAKQEILALRNKADNDLRSRRGQIQKRERDLKIAIEAQQEHAALLARNDEELKEAEEKLIAREEEVATAREQVDRLLEEQNAALERVSGMTQEEAKRQLLANLKAQTRYEAAAMIKQIRDEAQRSAETEATKA